MKVHLLPVIDAKQAAHWDEVARDAGSPSRVLMESAGRGTAHVLANILGPRFEKGVVVAAGHGNNGGDGWVVARALHAVGVAIHVVEAGQERSPDCEANRALAVRDGVAVLGPSESWPPADVIVDALLGTGASGKPRGVIGDLAERLMQSNGKVVAVDGPTGLDLSTGEAHGPVRADLTVTFGGLRRGHLLSRDWCGRTVVLDIGFGWPSDDWKWPLLIDDTWSRGVLPVFDADAHKGKRGRVLIVGGEEGMAGAVHYAARAAFAAGAGLARIATQFGSAAALQENFPDVTVILTALGKDVEKRVLDAVEWADAVVLGPGLGRGDDRVGFVSSLLGKATCPVLLDADALHVGIENLLIGDAPRVFTPHVGEFKAAFPEIETVDADRFGAVAEAGRLTAGANGTVLLKGVPTVITSGDQIRVVASGNPGLATGGSGDVLSGIIGTFLANGLTPLDAASLGAHALGRAADIAAQRISVRSMRPTDVINSLRDLWKGWEEPGYKEPPVLLDLPMPVLK